MELLPDDLVIYISCYLSYGSMRQLCATSSTFFHLFSTNRSALNAKLLALTGRPCPSTTPNAKFYSELHKLFRAMNSRSQNSVENNVQIMIDEGVEWTCISTNADTYGNSSFYGPDMLMGNTRRCYRSGAGFSSDVLLLFECNVPFLCQQVYVASAGPGFNRPADHVKIHLLLEKPTDVDTCAISRSPEIEAKGLVKSESRCLRVTGSRLVRYMLVHLVSSAYSPPTNIDFRSTIPIGVILAPCLY